MKILNDNVAVLEFKGKERSDGGIILPDGAKEHPLSGTVVAVGLGEKMENGGRYPMEVAVGDVVFYPARVGDVAIVDSEELKIIPEKYILGVLIEADLEDEAVKHPAITQTPENMALLAEYPDGARIPVDGGGNITRAFGTREEEDNE